jgi:2-hydroxy-3-keto-5-methylthiopentenyl-1-phosphate phosphatase
VKIAVQCDFDGTITEGEISHLILNRFAEGDWKRIVKEFESGKISVAECMKKCFAMIKVDEATITDFILNNDRLKIRHGFRELYDYCLKKGYYFVVVSNGLVFYIEAILDNIGMNGIEVIAARAYCSPLGMKVEYLGIDDKGLPGDFKEAQTRRLEEEGYKVVCLGDSISDIYTARRAWRVFATRELSDVCRKEGVNFVPYSDFFDIIRGLEAINT